MRGISQAISSLFAGASRLPPGWQNCQDVYDHTTELIILHQRVVAVERELYILKSHRERVFKVMRTRLTMIEYHERRNEHEIAAAFRSDQVDLKDAIMELDTNIGSRKDLVAALDGQFNEVIDKLINLLDLPIRQSQARPEMDIDSITTEKMILPDLLEAAEAQSADFLNFLAEEMDAEETHLNGINDGMMLTPEQEYAEQTGNMKKELAQLHIAKRKLQQSEYAAEHQQEIEDLSASIELLAENLCARGVPCHEGQVVFDTDVGESSDGDGEDWIDETEGLQRTSTHEQETILRVEGSIQLEQSDVEYEGPSLFDGVSQIEKPKEPDPIFENDPERDLTPEEACAMLEKIYARTESWQRGIPLDVGEGPMEVECHESDCLDALAEIEYSGDSPASGVMPLSKQEALCIQTQIMSWDAKCRRQYFMLNDAAKERHPWNGEGSRIPKIGESRICL